MLLSQRTKNVFAFLLWLFTYSDFYSQTKPHFHFRPVLITERSKPFEFKRSASFNYKLCNGAGAVLVLHFEKQISAKPSYFNIGPSVSQLLFWNPEIKTTEYALPYKEKNLVSALCLNTGLSVGTFSTFASGKAFNYHVHLMIGAAYVQNSFYFPDSKNGINISSWRPLVGIDFGFWYFNPRWRIPMLGFSIHYANLGGKHLHGIILN